MSQRASSTYGEEFPTQVTRVSALPLPPVQILAKFILRTSLRYYELRIEGTVFLQSLGHLQKHHKYTGFFSNEAVYRLPQGLGRTCRGGDLCLGQTSKFQRIWGCTYPLAQENTRFLFH